MGICWCESMNKIIHRSGRFINHLRVQKKELYMNKIGLHDS